MPDHGGIKDYNTRVLMGWVKRELASVEDRIGRVVREGLVNVMNDADFDDITCKTLTSTGNVTVGNDLSVADDLTVTDVATLSGNATVGGTLGVTGATTLTGNVTAQADLTCDGNIRGSIMTLCYGRQNMTGPNLFRCPDANWTSATVDGYIMPRDGTIVGCGWQHTISSLSTASSVTLRIQIYVNGVKVTANSYLERSGVVAADLTPVNDYVTQDRADAVSDGHVFSAGDPVIVRLNILGHTAINVDRQSVVLFCILDT